MKNRKNIILVIVVVLVLLVGGYFFISKNRNSNSGGLNGGNNKDTGLFASIKDALSKDLTLSCEFNDENASFKSYIKNGAVRVTTNSTDEGRSGEMIMKDDKMYIWDTKTNEGFVYEIPKNGSEDGQGVGLTGSEVVSSESYLDLIDKYKDSCEVATIEDSFFVIPTNVKFQDMAKMLQDLQNQMPQYEIPGE